MEKVNISQKQARAFAEIIFADIAAYIHDHPDEYNEFLRSEAAYAQERSKI